MRKSKLTQLRKKFNQRKLSAKEVGDRTYNPIRVKVPTSTKSTNINQHPIHPGKATNVTNVSDFTGDIMDLDVPETEWLVGDLLGTGFLTFAGYGKVGKTALALQLAYAVKTGSQFLGFSVQEREVFFVQLEVGVNLIQKYVGKQNLPREILKWKFNTKESRSRESLTEENILREIEEFINRPPKGDGLIIIDSLSRLIPDLDHNDTRTINPLYVKLQDMVRDTQATILLIDHTNKSILNADSNSQGAISGSASKTSRTDGFMVLRQRKKDTKSLDIGGYFPSRNIVITMDTSTLLWSLVGSEDSVKLEENYGDIVKAIESLGGKANNRQIAKELYCDESNLTKRMNRAVNKGYFLKEREGKNTFYEVQYFL